MIKFNYKNWVTAMRAQKEISSPVLSIMFDKYSIPNIKSESPLLPFYSCNAHDPSDNLAYSVSFVGTPTVTTAIRLEAVLLRMVAKTNFDNFEDKQSIVLGRYKINPSAFSKALLERLFSYVVNNPSNRISKSWLPYLQELILEKEDSKKVKSSSKKKLSFKGKPLEERASFSSKSLIVDLGGAVKDPFEDDDYYSPPTLKPTPQDATESELNKAFKASLRNHISKQKAMLEAELKRQREKIGGYGHGTVNATPAPPSYTFTWHTLPPPPQPQDYMNEGNQKKW